MKKVAIYLSPGFNNEILIRGLIAYTRSTSPWDLLLCPPSSDLDVALKRIERFEPDGIIGGFVNRDTCDRVLGLGIPAVDVSNNLPITSMPRVVNDDQAIGELAAGFLFRAVPKARTLAFIGPQEQHFAQHRYQSFSNRVAKEGKTFRTLDVRARSNFAPQITRDRIIGFVRQLAQPVGVFAANDWIGLAVIESIRQAQLPTDRFCVLGVDNVKIVCETSIPRLSSIEPAWMKIGFTGASLLADLMAGREAAHETLIPPLGVVDRTQTRSMEEDDEIVAAAINFISQNTHRPITIEEVTSRVPTSRKTLERRVRRLTGKTLLQHIHLSRVDRAKRLLKESSLSIDRIATLCGFTNATNFGQVFKAQMSQTPTGYRRAPRDA